MALPAPGPADAPELYAAATAEENGPRDVVPDPDLTAAPATEEATATTPAAVPVQADERDGAARPRPPLHTQRLSIHPIDPAELAPYFDATNAVRVTVSAHTSDLFGALATYVASEDGGVSTSLALPPRVWKEVKRDDGAESSDSDADGPKFVRVGGRVHHRPSSSRSQGSGKRVRRPYTVRYHAGMGVHGMNWEGGRLWVVAAASWEPVEGMCPDFLHTFFLYAPLGDGNDDGPTAARARLSSFVRYVSAWEAARVDRPLKPRYFELWRFKVDNPSRGHWATDGVHLSRPLDSVILPPATRQRLVDDARSFGERSARTWYATKGVPYRRCYLLHGPPGTGKSSFVRALAGELRRPVAFLQAAAAGMSDALLADAFRDVPRRAIMVLEDLDCLFLDPSGTTGDAAAGGSRQGSDGMKITMSGLLNTLDGLVSGSSGRLTVLTSNHPNRIDAALLRPGRVDLSAAFPMPGHAEARALFRSFYPAPEDEAAATAFADAVTAGGAETPPSLSILQQLFIQHRTGTADDVVSGVPAFLADVAETTAARGGVPAV